MNFIRRWLAERRFDREHRPYLTPLYAEPVKLPDGSQFQPQFMVIYCQKHGCRFSECPM